MASAKGRTAKVGIFVLAGIVLATILVFVIGDSRRVWERKVTYLAVYDDVVGLKPGSIVRMGGVDIGAVSDVRHKSETPTDSRVYVEFSIARSMAPRIRRATVATIEGKGFLGDKMVQLVYDEELAKEMRKAGQENPEEVVPPGGVLRTAPPGDPIGDAQKAAVQAKLAMQNLQKATEQIADDKFKEDLHGTVSALREILDGVAHGDGAAHRLIYDKNEAERVDRILANLETTSRNLALISADAKDISARAKTGPGLVHSVVYDGDLAQGTSGAVVELYRSLEAVRTGNGLAHTIVYGDDKSQHLMANMNAISDDLREIVANMKAGRGTVGALLVDPSVYEDVKSLVGNVERNQVLRALVRYSIKQNEDKPHAEVDGAAKAPDKAQPGASR